MTGLVQEFQFGMSWGAYLRLVGNIFGALLAMGGLAAFFLESTFLGLWLFGRDKLPRRIHLATIWAVSAGASAPRVRSRIPAKRASERASAGCHPDAPAFPAGHGA
jgi:cytochrome bd-type quinol oxidase subunit 1